jgi:hypothetical protein
MRGREFLALVGLIVAATQALAQNWPQQAIHFIISFGAGGGADIVGGAGGILGNELVASAKPDGYTLGILTAGQMLRIWALVAGGTVAGQPSVGSLIRVTGISGLITAVWLASALRAAVHCLPKPHDAKELSLLVGTTCIGLLSCGLLLIVGF